MSSRSFDSNRKSLVLADPFAIDPFGRARPEHNPFDEPDHLLHASSGADDAVGRKAALDFAPQMAILLGEFVLSTAQRSH